MNKKGVKSNLPDEMRRARLDLHLRRIFRDDVITRKRKEQEMGYRSQVAYTIRFTGDDDTACKHDFYTFLAEAKTKFPSAIGDEHLSIDEPNFALNFLAESVKWYEDYEDVKCHMALLQLAQSWAEDGDEKNGVAGNTRIGGIFTRIGEDTDDMTEESFGNYDWQWVQISRQVIVDWA